MRKTRGLERESWKGRVKKFNRSTEGGKCRAWRKQIPLSKTETDREVHRYLKDDFRWRGLATARNYAKREIAVKEDITTEKGSKAVRPASDVTSTIPKNKSTSGQKHA
ncbi:unnamed protein product [Pylaiella littoralis]